MSSTTAEPHRRLQPHKRTAITCAARAVFGRDGYSRASIDAIAAEAGVSTRTIYKHFENKQQLFSSVLEASATQVADGFIANLAEALTGITDPERYLVTVGLILIRQPVQFPEHFAMIRQISAEAAHFPAATLTAWREAGPRRVEREVGRHLRKLADRGVLHGADPARAVRHFIGLITAEIPNPTTAGGTPDPERLSETITAGVNVFLHGYARRPGD